MPLTNDQADLQLCQKEVRKLFTAETGNAGVGFTEHATKIKLTEVGMQISAVTGFTSLTMAMRQQTTSFKDGHHYVGAGNGWVAVASPPSSHVLTGVGTAIYRPPGGVELVSVFGDPISGRAVIQSNLKLTLVGTNWSGLGWIKYAVMDTELYYD